MSKNNNFLKLLIIMIFSIVIVSCVQKPEGNVGVENDSALEDKNQEIILTGKISKSGNLYLITTTSGKIQDLESYTIEFDKYLGKNVTVVGEFSGDTFFVTNLE